MTIELPFESVLTAYYPSNDPVEGGFSDRRGNPLHTLQDFLRGDSPYVSVAMDVYAKVDGHKLVYGTHLRIPHLEAKYGRPIQFRVVDTGQAFIGKNTSRIDICTENKAASLDPAVNTGDAGPDATADVIAIFETDEA